MAVYPSVEHPDWVWVRPNGGVGLFSLESGKIRRRMHYNSQHQMSHVYVKRSRSVDCSKVLRSSDFVAGIPPIR